MASKSKIFSLLLLLLLSFSHHCLSHYCKCQCDMATRKNSTVSGSGSSNSEKSSSGSQSSNTGGSGSSGSASYNLSDGGSSGSASYNLSDGGSSGSASYNLSDSGSSNTGGSSSGSLNSGSSGSVSFNSSDGGSSNTGGSSSGSSNSGNFGSESSNSGGGSSNTGSSTSVSWKSQSSTSNNSPLDFGFKPCFKNIIAFGDSFTDTGNTGRLGGLKAFANVFLPGSPYGSSSSTHFGPRFSDGKVLVDFLSEVLHLPYLAPFQNSSADFSKGVNFAVGGSSAFPGDFFKNNNVGRTLTWKTVPDCLQKQMDWFQQYLNNLHCDGLTTLQCKAKLANSLFWVGEMGFNDYARNFGASMTIQSIMEKLIDFKVNLCKTLLDKGAKFMIVQGLPPLGCFPLHLSTASPGDKDEHGCSSSLNSIVKTHNDLLRKKLDGLRVQFPDCFISFADFSNAFFTILKNPLHYGFTETFKACCGSGTGPFQFKSNSLCGSPNSAKCKNPANFMSWDGLHPTQALFGKMADLLFNQSFCNPPFKQLLNAASKA